MKEVDKEDVRAVRLESVCVTWVAWCFASIAPMAGECQPEIVSSIEGKPFEVAVVDSTAFVANGLEGLLIVDVTDPANPRILGSVATPGEVRTVAVSGGVSVAYVANSDSGLQVIDISSCQSGAPRFLRGDCDDDGAVDISDASCVLNWLFLGASAPRCVATTNTNGDADVDISDATYLLNHLFLGGPPLAPPFPVCGTSALEADEALGCDETPAHCP